VCHSKWLFPNFLPIVEPGQDCNTTDGAFDPCDDDFRCSNNKCIPNGRYARVNDGCIDDTYCLTGLTCIGNICKNPNTQGTCLQSAFACGWNEYCDLGVCKPRRGFGEPNCTLTGCKYRSTCLIDRQVSFCVEDFSLPEGSKCTNTIQCKAGLDCKDSVCTPPKLLLLSGAGALWGLPCDQSLSLDSRTGCKCNYALGNYFFLKETTNVYFGYCNDRRKEYEKCMIEKGCTNENDGYLSCLRVNCYHVYRTLDTCNQDTSVVMTRCSASTMMIGIFMIAILLLL